MSFSLPRCFLTIFNIGSLSPYNRAAAAHLPNLLVFALELKIFELVVRFFVEI